MPNSPARGSISRPPTSSARCSNFGLAAPIDIQIQDPNFTARLCHRPSASCDAIQQIPGVVDRASSQVLDFPALQIDVDRQRAARLGHHPARRRQQHADLARRQRAGRRRPTYLNPQNGVNYIVAVQTPPETHQVRRRRAQAFRPTRRRRTSIRTLRSRGAHRAAGLAGDAYRRHRLGAVRPPACSR